MWFKKITDYFSHICGHQNDNIKRLTDTIFSTTDATENRIIKTLIILYTLRTCTVYTKQKQIWQYSKLIVTTLLNLYFPTDMGRC